MKLYLDTADVNEWADLMPTGLFHGITTNPLLASRAGLDYPQIDWNDMAAKARDLGAQELHAQVYGASESYQEWAGVLYEVGRAQGIETIVKIPLTNQAIRTVGSVNNLGGRVLMTACYDAKQMFVATALGADFIAPYFGRMLENQIDAFDHLAQMKAVENNSEKPCKVLVASLRNTDQMCQLAQQGQDAFTISPAIARALLDDPLSIKAVEEFEATITR